MILPKARIRGTALLISLLSFLIWNLFDNLGSTAEGRGPVVGVVFFSSKNCPHCESVKELVSGLRVTYPIRVKTFDIEREADYLLFQRLESIHASGKFSVPLIMLGDTILTGENEIAEQLEGTVQKLVVSGGAPYPFLGTGKAVSHAARREKPKPHVNKRARVESDADRRSETQAAVPAAEDCPTCNKKGRPPSLREEWSKIKGLIDKYF